MVKESILFVVSTGLLIYFVTPSDAPPKADPGADEVQKPVARATQPSDDGWGYDDGSDEGDETFQFGEPLTSFDNEYDSDDEPATDEESSNSQRQERADVQQSSSWSSSRRQASYSAGSPGPSEKGGIDNPIIFETRTPSDPVDD